MQIGVQRTGEMLDKFASCPSFFFLSMAYLFLFLCNNNILFLIYERCILYSISYARFFLSAKHFYMQAKYWFVQLFFLSCRRLMFLNHLVLCTSQVCFILTHWGISRLVPSDERWWLSWAAVNRSSWMKQSSSSRVSVGWS